MTQCTCPQCTLMRNVCGNHKMDASKVAPFVQQMAMLFLAQHVLYDAAEELGLNIETEEFLACVGDYMDGLRGVNKKETH